MILFLFDVLSHEDAPAGVLVRVASGSLVVSRDEWATLCRTGLLDLRW